MVTVTVIILFKLHFSYRHLILMIVMMEGSVQFPLTAAPPTTIGSATGVDETSLLSDVSSSSPLADVAQTKTAVILNGQTSLIQSTSVADLTTDSSLSVAQRAEPADTQTPFTITRPPFYPPNFDYAVPSYEVALDLSGLEARNFRIGAFWTLTSKDTAADNGTPCVLPPEFAANIPKNGGTAAPSLLPQSTDPVPVSDETKTSCGAILFQRTPNSCLLLKNGSANDACLNNPQLCVDGLTVSLWVELPNLVYNGPMYILDTGGRTYAGASGISIVFYTSNDGIKYEQELEVIVSNGSYFWKLELLNMVQPNTWVNLAIRWNSSLGLQVFVNKQSSAWKIHVSGVSDDVTDNVGRRNASLSVGCRLDGAFSMHGKVSKLAVFYWRLISNPEIADPEKPFPGNSEELWEMDFVDGDEEGVATPPDEDYITVPPPQFKNENKLVGHSEPIGSCIPHDPSSWGIGATNPVQCSDTLDKLDDTLGYATKMGNKTSTGFNFSAVDVAHAALRTVKNPSTKALDPMNISDLVRLTVTGTHNENEPYGQGLVKLGEIPDGTVNATEELKYFDIVAAASELTKKTNKLQNWYQQQFTNGAPGVTIVGQMLDMWLLSLTRKLKMPDDGGKDVSNVGVSNSTPNIAVRCLQLRPEDLSKESLNLKFQSKSVSDLITLPAKALQPFTGTTEKIVYVTKIYETYGEYIPAVLDKRISGDSIGENKFFVNSRILSASLETGSASGKPDLAQFPVTFTVSHLVNQEWSGYLKAAILCVSWNYNSDPTKSGAWDTAHCSVVFTNDTSTTCQCQHMTDYAILMEDIDTPRSTGYRAWTVLAYILQNVSLLCLFIFMFRTMTHVNLHYEIHMIHLNVAFALFVVFLIHCIVPFISADRLACLVASVVLHYFYTSAYSWFLCAIHYTFRVLTTSKFLGILPFYCFVSWDDGILVFAPILAVAIPTGLDCTQYGWGSRCLGYFGQFMRAYIGIFFTILCFGVPFIAGSFCHLDVPSIPKSSKFWPDFKQAWIGHLVLWAWFLAIWFSGWFVYAEPHPSIRAFQYLFDFFHGSQGILVLLCLGYNITSWRQKYTGKPEPRKEPPVQYYH